MYIHLIYIYTYKPTESLLRVNTSPTFRHHNVDISLRTGPASFTGASADLEVVAGIAGDVLKDMVQYVARDLRLLYPVDVVVTATFLVHAVSCVVDGVAWCVRVRG